MAIDSFLKIDTIPGESADSAHKDEIELSSFYFEEANSGSFAAGGGGGSGKVKMNNFEFTARSCKASPKLMFACATGQHIPSATLTCRKAGGGQQDFFMVKFTDVLVSKYVLGSSLRDGSSESQGEVQGYAEGAPMDRFALNFAKIEFEYKPQKADGSLDSPVKTGYSLKENKAV